MIEIVGLSKTYGKQKALENIDVSIHRGEVVGLLGPNGAGKSTLMKSMVGVVSPEAGKISLDGEDIRENPWKAKKKIGYLPENNPLYYDMYVREYLTWITDIRQIKREKVEEVIEKVKLTEEQNKKIRDLSKGYKQRVGLAQAIIFEPEILILDEPTNGLDPNQILEIRELIKSVGKEKTVIISTHIMQEVEALCQRVVILNKGKKIADASLEELKSNEQSLEQVFHQLTQKL